MRVRTVVLVWAAAVVAVSVAAAGRAGWVEALAASPDRVRGGKLWFLVSSAVLVDRPLALSLVSFLGLAALALVVCGPRVFWRSAVAGQVVATLLVYAFIGAVRLMVADAFDSTVMSPDFGVSTISAAWLGSIATVAWRRRGRTWTGKSSIALSCAAVGVFAYTIRPDLTVLSAEHPVAFALGVGCAVPYAWSRLARRATAGIRRVDPLVAAAVSLVVLAAAVDGAAPALATLRNQIAAHLRPTVVRCATNWNRGGGVPRVLVVHDGVRVSISPERRDCRYAFGSVLVVGRWRHGRVHGWDVRRGGTRSALPNATLDARGRVHLVRQKARPVLSS